MMDAPTLRTPLAPEDLALLKAAAENNGFTLGRTCEDAGLPTDRKGIAAAHQRMLYLEMHDLVRRMDGGKPIIWLRTPEGSEQLRIWEDPSALHCDAGETDR